MEFAYDPSRHRLNLAVSNLMTFSNDIEKSLDASPTTLGTAMDALAVMLHPLAPHTSAELRETLQRTGPLKWPTPIRETIKIE
jgi:leucyl-tRNA synthetase